MSVAAPAATLLEAALAEQVRVARREETMLGLMAGAYLRTLRDERLWASLSATTLGLLIDREIPSLDRGSARRLLLLADTFGERDPGALLDIGLPRLAELAAAPADLIGDLLITAEHLPTDELRRAVRSAAEEREAADLRGGRTGERETDGLVGPSVFVDARDEQTRQALGRDLLGRVSRAWAELTNVAFVQARTLAALRDQEAWRGTEYSSLEDFCAVYLGLGASELRRSLLLGDRVGMMAINTRNRIGLGALRALASLDDETTRAELLTLVRTDDQLGAEGVLEAVRQARRPGNVAQMPAATARHFTDNPDSLAAFDVLYLPDQADSGIRFADRSDPVLVEQIILRTTRPGGTICDLTAGVGTVAEVAQRLDRTCVSIDRLDPPMASGVAVGDARTDTPAGGPFDLVVFHPPIPDEVRYSERYAGIAQHGDLSLLTADAYARACAEIFAHARDLVISGGSLALIARPGRTREELIDWPGRLSVLATRASWLLTDRWTAVVGPAERADRLRRNLFRARRDNVSVNVSWEIYLFRPDERRNH